MRSAVVLLAVSVVAGLLGQLFLTTVHAVPAEPKPSHPPHVRYVPPRGARPAPVLVALHGIGDRGSTFTEGLLARAQAEGWVLVAPTMPYGDWRNPTAVANEDPQLVENLRQMIQQLPLDVGIPIEPRVMLYGFSRGGQLAHRFALVNPELVRATIVFGAGTYTLPQESFETNGGKVLLTWPYGCGGDFAARFGHKLNVEQLRSIPFMVGVGELDNNPADLPRQWDQYVGNNRVERARSFARALSDQGVPTRFMVFPRTGHSPGGLQRNAGLDFLSRVLYREDEPNPQYDRPFRDTAA